MNREYNILLRIARWIRRFRKRQGYGVHSPFAFQFITDVVYCTDPYYAYETLRRPLEPSIARLDEYDPASGLTAKDLRLLFRIANWAEPDAVSLYGASTAVEAHIRAARPSSLFLPPPSPSPLPSPSLPSSPLPSPSLSSSPLLVYAGSTDHLAQLLTSLSAAASTPITIIVRGIHTSQAALARWEQLKDSALCTVSFDLGRFGIIVRRPKINTQHYVVNYF